METPFQNTDTLQNDYLTTDSALTKKMSLINGISISLFVIGIFAFIGGLYSWGNGPIWNMLATNQSSQYLTDMLIVSPISIISGFGIYNLKRWGLISGIFCAGLYIYGSILVYIDILLSPGPIPFDLIIPPVFGIGVSIVILFTAFRHQNEFS